MRPEAVPWDELGLEQAVMWRRGEEGHCRGRKQFKVTHRCTERGRDEKKEACVVGCEKASTPCKTGLLCRPWGRGAQTTVSGELVSGGAILGSPLTDQQSWVVFLPLYCPV